MKFGTKFYVYLEQSKYREKKQKTSRFYWC